MYDFLKLPAAVGTLKITESLNESIPSNIKDFGTVMIVCKMKHEKEHNNIASEFFHYSQTMAILPLKGKVSSIVVTVPISDSKHLLSMDKNIFNKHTH